MQQRKTDQILSPLFKAKSESCVPILVERGEANLFDECSSIIGKMPNIILLYKKNVVSHQL